MSQNMFVKRIVSVGLAGAFAVSLSVPAFAASPEVETAAKKVAVKSVKLNYSAKTIKKGKSVTLKATVSPKNASNKKVTWKSSKKSVAKVSSKGKVTGVKNGKATITAITKSGNKKASCAIIVGTPVTKVKLNKTSASLDEGKTLTLKATLSPKKPSNKGLTWKSDKTSVATVSSKGKVTAKKAGKATITATAKDGSKKSAKCVVTVKAATVAVTGVTLDKTTASLAIGDTTKLTASVAPANATNGNITWSSSKSAVASVKDGTVTAVAAGDAVITATAAGNTTKKATCAVTVYAPQTLAEAKAAAITALDNFTATNATTDANVLKVVTDAVTDPSITAAWSTEAGKGFDKTDADTSAAGGIEGEIILSKGADTETVDVSLTIAKLQSLSEAKIAANAALGSFTATNTTTADEVLAAVTATITNDAITAAWSTVSGEGFDKTDATNLATGAITGKIILTLDANTEDVTVSLTIAQLDPEDQAAPTGLDGVAPTSTADNDGKITGTTTAMEYKVKGADDTTYAACSATETTGLAAGTYEVRFAAKTGYNAGATAEVVVSAYVEVKSDAKEITTTTIGTLDSINKIIIDVPALTTVDAFKTALSVSPLATVEILDGSGGTPVANPSTTNIDANMVIQVTAEDGTTQEYTIEMQ